METKEKARRKGGPRSRSGCNTCKVRHVKCDETKPSCRQCVATGRNCDGYAAQPTRRQANAALLNISSYAIPFTVPGSQKDRRLLHYFCVKGATELSGYLPSVFWNYVVLQRSHDQQAVRQAVTALSSLHLDYTAADTTSMNGGNGSEESNVLYNRALRSLRKYLSNGVDSKERVSPTIPLVCCALFYCFESARGNVEAALQHLRSGIMILNKTNEGTRETGTSSNNGGGGSSNSSEIDDIAMLEEVLYRLDIQATIFDDMRIPLLVPSPAEILWGSYNSFPSSLASVGEAQSTLTKLQNWLLRFLISNEEYKFWLEECLPPSIKEEKSRLTEAYANWGREFDVLDQKLRLQQLQAQFEPPSRPPATSASQLADDLRTIDFETIHSLSLTVVRIHYLTFRLLLESSLPHDPTVFSAAGAPEHKLTINIILELTERVLAFNTNGSTGETNNRTVSAETGIVAPLFLLIMKSGDAAVVKRAMSLLAASNRREGPYDARVMIGIVERIKSHAGDGVAEGLLGYGDYTVVVDPLEYVGGDNINVRVGGVNGIAKNLGVISSDISSH